MSYLGFPHDGLWSTIAAMRFAGLDTVRSYGLVALIACPMACGAGDTDTRHDASMSTDAATDGDGATPSHDVMSLPVSDAGPVSGCSEDSQLIYLISDSNDLYRYDPRGAGTHHATRLGAIQCEATDPDSLAIDLLGNAYVSYRHQLIYQLDTTTLACTAVTYADGSGMQPMHSAMAFASPDRSPGNGALFLTGDGTAASLYTLDLGRGRLETAGMLVEGANGNAPGMPRLTGTGDGRLIAFGETGGQGVVFGVGATGTLTRMFTIDPTTADPVMATFVFWGGSLYFFDSPGRLGASNVYRVSLTGTATPDANDITFWPRASAVSPCAPLLPPG